MSEFGDSKDREGVLQGLLELDIDEDLRAALGSFFVKMKERAKRVDPINAQKTHQMLLGIAKDTAVRIFGEMERRAENKESK